MRGHLRDLAMQSACSIPFAALFVLRGRLVFHFQPLRLGLLGGSHAIVLMPGSHSRRLIGVTWRMDCQTTHQDVTNHNISFIKSRCNCHTNFCVRSFFLAAIYDPCLHISTSPYQSKSNHSIHMRYHCPYLGIRGNSINTTTNAPELRASRELCIFRDSTSILQTCRSSLFT